MYKTLKLVIRYTLLGALIVLGLFIIIEVSIAVRYSPAYVYRELFMDLGSPYDYQILPERKLTASSNPFLFVAEPSKQTLVQETFQLNPKISNLDAFLSDTDTQAFLVIQDDTIIYERYFKGYQRDSIVTSFSVAKSFDWP